MLPIAENFHSPQGEGFWSGTSMHFIRLAGCPVGKAASEGFPNPLKPYTSSSEINVLSTPLPILHNGRVGSMCRTWDGRYFACDTDFSCSTHKTIYELLGETWEKHICLTGGEPLVHQRLLVSDGLFAEAHQRGIKIHIETSGTILLHPALMDDNRLWITVSPKWGYIEEMIMRADEIKFLVDEQFDIKRVAEVMQWSPRAQIWLSPINDELTPIKPNITKTLELLKQNPDWKICTQVHKFLGVR